jgi:CMP-N-acetylneuraminic acid synthetase
MTKIAALVPMRHHSQRVPGKNYRMLGGKPLFHHIIETLLDVRVIDEVIVDTDSPIIKHGLTENFPQVKVIDRPNSLQADDVPMNAILLHDVSLVEADYYLQTHCTNPLLRAQTITEAIQTFLDKIDQYDSLFSVTRWQTRLWDQDGHPVNHNPDILLQTQDLPLFYEENSCMYIFLGSTLIERRNRLGERPLMYEINSAEAWDIDEELDFAIVDFLMKERKNE